MASPLAQGILNALFPVSRYGGLLTPDDEQMIRRQGILQLGANLLQGGAPQAVQRGTLGNLGFALSQLDIPGAVQSAARMRAVTEQLEEDRRAREAYQQISRKYPVMPGEDAEQRFNRLSSIVSDLVGVPGSEDLIGKLSNVLAQLRPPRELRPRYSLRNMPDDEARTQWGLYRVNLDDPTDRTRIGPGTAPPGVVGSGQVAGQRTVLAKMAEDALAALDAVGQTPPNLLEQAAGSPLGQQLGGQFLLNEARQIQNQAGTQFTEAVLRFTTGAVAPIHELQQYIALLTLRAGDKPGVSTRKLQAQRTLLQSLQRLAARGEINPDEAASLLQRAALGVQGPARATAPGPATGGSWLDHLPPGSRPR